VAASRSECTSRCSARCGTSKPSAGGDTTSSSGLRGRTALWRWWGPVLEGPAYTASPNGPLATHVKAAFADALTWAPDYPGIGSIPRIVSGHVASSREVDSRDAEAMVRNMMRDELGKRTFILGGGPTADLE
jgi:hypothetical protein